MAKKPNKAAASNSAPPQTSAIDNALLKAVVDATKSNSFVYAPQDKAKVLVDAGLAMTNSENVPLDANGNIATRATDAGIAAVESAAQAPTSAQAPTWGNTQTITQQDVGKLSVGTSAFKLETGVAIPEAKRGFGKGNGGQGRKSIYPFEEMQPGQSFFVAPTADMPEPQKTLGSTVSSATLRYAELDFNADGSPKMVESLVAQRDAEGNIMKDGTGKTIRNKVMVQAKRQTRKYQIRGVTENGVKGARIWRTA